MSKIVIDILEESKQYSLVGDIESLLKKKRIVVFFKDFLKAVITDNEVLVPFEDKDREKLLGDIQDILSDLGIEEERSDNIENTLAGYIQEEKNFQEFSQQARSIRNKEFSAKNKKEFKLFKESLEKYLPNRRLYELQFLSAYHLAFSQNACNFSVPGAGKTSVVYGAYAYLKSLPKSNPKHIEKLLIVGPLSSFGPWEMEYLECFGVAADAKRLAGGISKKEKLHHLYSGNPSEITLLSYNSVPILLEDLKFFLDKYKTMVVLDEAHKIKNLEGGIWATAALELARHCKSRVVLTGTPAPNGYEDVFNLFKFIWPTKEIIQYYPFQLKAMSDNSQDPRIETLVNDVSPYFIRIRKSDLNLPPPVENEPIVVEMGKIQQEIYSYIEKNYMDYFIGQSTGSASVKSILTRARLIRLMQASTNPGMLRKPLDDYYMEQGYSSELFVDDSEMFNKILDYDKLETPNKFIMTLELIKELIAKNEKVIIWTIFIQNILELKDYLAENQVNSKVLYGATPIEGDESEGEIETREAIIRDFHRIDCEYKVLIANPFAIAESISLHKACHNAIYLERSFNAGNFIQSKDRIHRYGLQPTDQINYYYILSNNNIDITIHQRLLEKEERMMRMIESQPIPLFNVLDESNSDDEDLRVLVENYVNKKV
jgi:SNF2 family DNA or RNA helicase